MSHEFEGETFPERDATIADNITGAEYDGFPLKLMSLDALLDQGAKQEIVNYVWSHEGQFKNGKWRFHRGKVIDGTTEIDCPNKPLMVDALSARGFKLVWEAINDINKQKTREFLASRGLTVWAFEKLIWPNVNFGEH